LIIFSLIGFHRRNHRNDYFDIKIAGRDGRERKVLASRLGDLTMLHVPAHFLIFGVNLAYLFKAFKFSLLKNIPRFRPEAPSPHARIEVKETHMAGLEILGFDHPHP
jgi:hypothetical protein